MEATSTSSVTRPDAVTSATAIGAPHSPEASATSVAVLAFCLTCALAVLVIAPALTLFEPTDLPDPFPDQNQGAENFLFIFTLLIALPTGLLAAPFLVRRVETAGNGRALSACSGILLAGLAGVGGFVKASERLPWGGGIGTLAVAIGLWWLLAAGLLGAATRVQAGRRLARLVALTPVAWAAAAAALGLLLLSFTELSKVSLPVLLVGVALAGALIAVVDRSAGWPRVEGWRGLSLDLLAAGLLFAAVVNLVIFTPEDPSPAASLETTIIQFHQNFLLGPANHVLAGDAMLVDTFSQYGVGSIYFLAGVFQFVPAGNGTIGLIDATLSALTFVAALAVCRIAGTSRLLAVLALGIAVVPLVYALDYPLGALLQHGGLRFGMPMLLLLAVVAEARWAARAAVRRGSRVVQFLVVGVSAIWALEALIYTTATVAALLAVGASFEPRAERIRWLGRRAAAVAAAWLTAHLLLAGLTLAFAGSLPEWGNYLDTLRAFLTGPVGDLTYDFSPFSAGLLVVGGYLASVIGLFSLRRFQPALFRRERTAVLAIVGSTAYGIALFSYFVNRSSDHILPYVSLPLVVSGVLWLGLIVRSPELGGLRTRQLALGFAAILAALTVSVAAPSVETRFEQSALGLALPGGDSPRSALLRLFNPPPLDRDAPVGEQLLERRMPGEDRSLVITSADLGVEILVRSGRANTLPLADPWEDSLVPFQHVDAIEQSVAGLQAGDRMLIDEDATAAFAEYRRDPTRDPIADPVGFGSLVPNGTANVQQLALKEIGKRFWLREVEAGADGLRVVELVPRPSL